MEKLMQNENINQETFINNNDHFFTYAIDNSFRQEKQQKWHEKYRVAILSAAMTILAWGVVQLDIGLTSYRDTQLDKIAITVDFGDYVSLKKVQKTPAREYDEVFGNQYVKDKKVVKSEDYVDPRIATAVNPIIGGATRPVDLNPEVYPKYTLAAKQAGVEGTLMLEVIVSDDGKVLRAKPVGKTLGHGLEKSASAAFQRKRYKPSINKEGKAITVKFFQPVRFILE